MLLPSNIMETTGDHTHTTCTHIHLAVVITTSMELLLLCRFSFGLLSSLLAWFGVDGSLSTYADLLANAIPARSPHYTTLHYMWSYSISATPVWETWRDQKTEQTILFDCVFALPLFGKIMWKSSNENEFNFTVCQIIRILSFTRANVFKNFSVQDSTKLQMSQIYASVVFVITCIL